MDTVVLFITVYVAIFYIFRNPKNEINKKVIFNAGVWVSKALLTKLSSGEKQIIENRIQYCIDQKLISNDSLLDYIINQRTQNIQRENETKSEFVIRLLKTDFEKTHHMSFDEFIRICKDIHKNEPQLLI